MDGREYDDESGEAGGFGSGGAKVKVTQHIHHDGEVNRARYMPQNSFVLAAKSGGADVSSSITAKHPSKAAPDSGCAPNIRLRGHQKEGYGLSWSPFKSGHLLSGSDDAQICLWGVSGGGGQGTRRANHLQGSPQRRRGRRVARETRSHVRLGG